MASKDMRGRKSREVAAKIARWVSARLCLSPVLAFYLRFNLSSATSLHLLLVTAIALRWGFIEASVVSLVSVACLDYFFTEPLFKLYMSDPHDWVALVTFESVALIVSRLSNQVSRHARESEARRFIYKSSMNSARVSFFSTARNRSNSSSRASFRPHFRFGASHCGMHTICACAISGICDVTEDEVRGTYFTERNEDHCVTHLVSPRAAFRNTSHRSLGNLRSFSRCCFDQRNRFADRGCHRKSPFFFRGKHRGSCTAK